METQKETEKDIHMGASLLWLIRFGCLRPFRGRQFRAGQLCTGGAV